MSYFRFTPLALAALISLSATPALANSETVDAFNDFLPTYTAGPTNGDLDVTAAAAFYDGANQTLSFQASFADNVGLTAGALYVWGIDRGLGTERFLAGSPSIGAGIFFDSVLIARQNGTGTYVDFINGTSTALDPAHINIRGSTITLNDLSTSLFAPDTTGFKADPSQYTWNLWPRLGAGNNNQVSDFAPDGTNLGFQTAAAVPEPETYAMLLAGLGLVGFVTRRKQKKVA